VHQIYTKDYMKHSGQGLESVSFEW